MLVKNLTPFFHGAVLTSHRERRAEMSLVVRGTFRIVDGDVVTAIEGLDQGLMSGELFAEDDPERRGELLYPGDFADAKLCAEVMLRGTCHAPGGAPVAKTTVGFAVGAWSKELAVFGDRTWETSALTTKASEPAPFVKLPLSWSVAYGGEGFEANPVGRGHQSARLPNVELPGDLVRSRGQVVRPAGFGPVSPHWSPRKELVGKTYDKAWAATRAPYAPHDLDWRWFHAAPVDQQLPAYLRGDEEVRFRNLHPTLAEWKTKLPSLRIRAFAKDDQGTIRELTMSLDTLFADTDAGTITLTWRGLCPVAETDFEDVKIVFIASEPLAQPPRDATSYHPAIAEFERDPTGVHAALPPGLVEAGEREAKRRRGEPVVDPTLPADVDPLTRELKTRLGSLMSDDDVAQTRATVAKASAVDDRAPPIDLTKAIAAAAAEERKNPPPPRVQKPGRLIDMRLRAQMREVLDEVARLRAVEKASDRKLEGIDEMEAIPREPRLKELDPDYEVPGPLSTDPPGPGADLRDRDLADQDLSGIDLSGADLSHANLAYAKLRGARLVGAKLHRTVLYGADLEGADLTGADLTLVNAGFVRAADAKLSKANLTEAFFEGAILTRAVLDEVVATYAIFSEADLTGVQARKACFDHADLAKAVLVGATLSEISARLALFSGCKAAKVQLAGATLDQASFAEADLAGASVVGAHARKAFFEKAVLDQADLSYAVLAGATFTSVRAFRARFHGADLKDARLYRSDLAQADLSASNLFSADLRKSNIEGARLTRANLYDAKLLDVRGGNFDLQGANLKRSVWGAAT